MLTSKPKHWYWTEATQAAVVAFNNSVNTHERNRLWNIVLAPALTAAINYQNKKNKFFLPASVLTECLTDIALYIHKFDPSRCKQNGLSWFLSKAYWYLRGVSKGDRRVGPNGCRASDVETQFFVTEEQYNRSMAQHTFQSFDTNAVVEALETPTIDTIGILQADYDYVRDEVLEELNWALQLLYTDCQDYLKADERQLLNVYMQIKKEQEIANDHPR